MDMRLHHLFQEESLPLSKALKLFRTHFISLAKSEGSSIDRFMYLILCISYAQIFFQVAQLARGYLPEAKDQSFSLQAIEDILTIDSIFTYDRADKFLFLTCICVVLYFVLLIYSFVATVYQTAKQLQINIANKIWYVLVQIHPYVLFFPIDNLCNKIQITFWNDSLQLFSFDIFNAILFYCSIIIYLINIFFAAFPYIFLFDLLPSKNSLSSKSLLIDQINLYQKLILSLLGKVFPNVAEIGWFIMGLALVFSIIRQFWFHYFLPRYHFTTLAIDLCLINVCSMTSILAFMVYGLNQAFQCDITITTFIAANILLIPLVSIYVYSTYKHTLKGVLLRPYIIQNPYRALHKVLILKDLYKYLKTPHWRTSRIEDKYFYFALIQSSPKNIFGKKGDIDANSDEINLNNKDCLNEIKRNYLETLMAYFDKTEEIKLLLAKFYIQKLNLYSLAIKTLLKIKSQSPNIRTSVDLLEHHIQEKIANKTERKETDINLHDYFLAENHKNALKKLISVQYDYQNSFWKEFTKNMPNVWELQRLSEHIHAQKEKIAKVWSRIEDPSNRGFYFLCSLFGTYEFLLNDSFAKGKEFLRKYNVFYSRHNQPVRLTSSNICDRNNFSITIRTSHDHLGNIINCSNKIIRFLGYDRHDLIGSNIGMIMTPFIGSRHNSFMQDYINTGQITMMKQLQTYFIRNRSGTLQKVSLWADIHPFVNEEIYLTGLFRPIHDPHNYIFLTPQGEVDSYTAGIASKLGLQGKKIHIKNICRDFMNIFGISNLTQEHENSRLNVLEESLHSTKVQSTLQKESLHATSSKNPRFTNERVKQADIDCQLEFNSYFVNSKHITSVLVCECEVRTMRVKDTYMTIIKILKFHEKRDMHITERNSVSTSRREGTDRKSENIKITEDFPHFHTGVGLLSPTDKIIHNDNFKTLFISDQKDYSPLLNKSSHLKYDLIGKKPLLLENAKPKAKNSIRVMDMHVLDRSAEQSVGASSTSLALKIETYIDDVFKVKYYPKSVKTFLVFLFIMFISSLTLELFLHIQTEQNLSRSKALAITVGIAISRVDSFTQIGRGARSAFCMQTELTPKGSAAYETIRKTIITNLETNIPIFKRLNSQLQIAIQDIDEVFQEKFKSVNVKLYDITPDYGLGPYQTFNGFLAINTIINKLLKIVGYYKANLQFVLEDVFYILVNSVNDALLVTTNAIDLILESTHLSFHSAVSILKICLVLRVVFFCLAGLAAFIFFYQIYCSELKFIYQYLEMSPTTIQLIRDRLDYFNKVFQSEGFEDLTELDLNIPSLEQKAAKVSKISISSDKQTSKTEKTLKTKSLQMFYWKKVLLFILLLFGYVGGTFYRFQEINNNLQSLEIKVNGLTKAQSILYEASILILTIGHIIGLTVHPIRGRTPDEELKADITNFLKSGYDLLEAFKNEDGTYDPSISKFFFVDSCSFMTPGAYAHTECLKIAKESKDLNLFWLLSRHCNIFINIYDDFRASNKSFPVRVDLTLRVISDGTPSTAVIRELVLALISQTQADLTELWESTSSNVNLGLIVFPLALLTIGMLVWIFILKHFVEFCNRFKRMMRIIPFDLLVKNPALKGTLMILSKQKLQKLKDQI